METKIIDYIFVFYGAVWAVALVVILALFIINGDKDIKDKIITYPDVAQDTK